MTKRQKLGEEFKTIAHSDGDEGREVRVEDSTSSSVALIYNNGSKIVHYNNGLPEGLGISVYEHDAEDSEGKREKRVKIIFDLFGGEMPITVAEDIQNYLVKAGIAFDFDAGEPMSPERSDTPGARLLRYQEYGHCSGFTVRKNDYKMAMGLILNLLESKYQETPGEIEELKNIGETRTKSLVEAVQFLEHMGARGWELQDDWAREEFRQILCIDEIADALTTLHISGVTKALEELELHPASPEFAVAFTRVIEKAGISDENVRLLKFAYNLNEMHMMQMAHFASLEGFDNGEGNINNIENFSRVEVLAKDAIESAGEISRHAIVVSPSLIKIIRDKEGLDSPAATISGAEPAAVAVSIKL